MEDLQAIIGGIILIIVILLAGRVARWIGNVLFGIGKWAKKQ